MKKVGPASAMRVAEQIRQFNLRSMDALIEKRSWRLPEIACITLHDQYANTREDMFDFDGSSPLHADFKCKSASLTGGV
jgi:hypothetical protein